MQARDVRRSAYAPYSRFSVGAALLTQSGAVFVGANVENASLGMTICAERAAVCAAVAAGVTTFAALAIIADSTEPAVPCGACRQVLAEFNPALRIITGTIAGEVEEFLLSDLLPRPNQGLFSAR